MREFVSFRCGWVWLSFVASNELIIQNVVAMSCSSGCFSCTICFYGCRLFPACWPFVKAMRAYQPKSACSSSGSDGGMCEKCNYCLVKPHRQTIKKWPTYPSDFMEANLLEFTLNVVKWDFNTFNQIVTHTETLTVINEAY